MRDGAPGGSAPILPDGDDRTRELLGRWRLLRADAALDFAPGARLDFRTEGRLYYGFDVGEGRQVQALCYRIDGDLLRTDHLATGHEMTTHFRVGAGGVLVLDFVGARAWFVREL